MLSQIFLVDFIISISRIFQYKFVVIAYSDYDRCELIGDGTEHQIFEKVILFYLIPLALKFRETHKVKNIKNAHTRCLVEFLRSKCRLFVGTPAFTPPESLSQQPGEPPYSGKVRKKFKTKKFVKIYLYITKKTSN